MSELGPLPVDEQCPIPTLDLRDAIRKEHGLYTLAEEQRWRQVQEQAKAYGITAAEAGTNLSALAQAAVGTSAWKVSDRRASTHQTDKKTEPSIGAACKRWFAASLSFFVMWWLSWVLQGSAAVSILFALLFAIASFTAAMLIADF